MNPVTTQENPGALVPVELYRKASDIASICRDIVLKTAVSIQDRKYVRVEGWQAIATAHGCAAGARDVEKIEDGFRCVGEVRRIDTGVVIANAEGFVGKDETTWFGGKKMVWDKSRGASVEKVMPKRDDYAIRAMCQTRAISRVCRSAFAHVVVLMDAGLSTTPAEEVPFGGFEDRPADGHVEAMKPAKAGAALDQDGDYELPAGVKWEDVKVHFGKNKGVKLGDLDPMTIGWYAEKWDPKPYGQNPDISQDDKLLLAAVNAWLAGDADHDDDDGDAEGRSR